MKIAPARASSFVNDIGRSPVFSVLVYGPDSGGVSNLANKLATQIVKDPNDPFSTASIDNERIAAEPTILFDEMSAISFFGGRKLVMLKNADSGKEIVEAIQQMVEGISEDAKKGAFLIVTAGDLPPTSALRKFYDANESVASLACYVEDEKDLSAKIMRIFAQKRLVSKERGIVEYLAESCQGDSKVIESEIEKLDLYLEGRREVMFEDVVATTGNTTETEMQDICDLICENKKGEAQIALAKAMDAGMQPIAVIRTLQRYIEKLHNCANAVSNEGKSIDSVIESVRPPIFFKQKPVFRNHLSLFMKKPANDVWNAYTVLYEAESELKSSGAEPELITSRALSKVL